MSLHSFDEICEGCPNAVWLRGERRTAFDYCLLDAETEVSHVDGSCPYYAPKDEPGTPHEQPKDEPAAPPRAPQEGDR